MRDFLSRSAAAAAELVQEAARAQRLRCLGFTGHGGGAMADGCELLFRAPAEQTAIIQQLHITAAHVFCALVERDMFRASALD
ncbi:MAG: hypothetical protein M3Y41_15420 [Pseudomonadota bacterium]|nr:hypothetical protein [Pseudomonadota bacterium]